MAKISEFSTDPAPAATDRVTGLSGGVNSNFLLSDIANLFGTGTFQYMAGWGRAVNLASFVSVYADPGNRIVFSDGTDIQQNLNNGGQMSTISQAQRRANFRIFMEACLYACGGTGAANGKGWYSTGSNTSQEAVPGSVFVPGPMWIEPYDTSALGATQNYAPAFAARGTWTLPAWLTLWGNGKSGGGTPASLQPANATWNSVRSRFAPRIVVVGSYLGWNPSGGPTPASPGRNVNGWTVDGIAVTRRGNTAGSVFYSGYYRDADNLWTSDFWRIKSLVVEQDGNDYSGQTPTHDGFVLRGAMDCYVDDLQVLGNGNLGWGILHTAGITGTAWDGLSLTCFYRKVLVQGSQRGAAWVGANCFVESINLESPTGNTHQLVLTSVNQARIGYLHNESSLDPTWSTSSSVLNIGSPAPSSTLGGVTNTFWEGASVNLEGAFFMGANNPFSSPWTGNPQYAIELVLGHLMIGGVWAARAFQTSMLHVHPTGGNPDDCILDFNSRFMRSDSAARLTYTAGPSRLANRCGETLSTPLANL